MSVDMLHGNFSNDSLVVFVSEKERVFFTSVGFTLF